MKLLLTIASVFFLSACTENKVVVDNNINYYTYGSRRDYISIEKYTPVIDSNISGKYFKYIGKDTINYVITVGNRIERFNVIRQDTSLSDSIQSYSFNINQNIYTVFRMITGSYGQDGQMSYFISTDFGYLGCRSDAWRAFTRRTFENDTSVASILTDVVFEFDEWRGSIH